MRATLFSTALAFSALAALTAPSAASAAAWALQPQVSQLGFTYYEDGAPVRGGFATFDGAADLDLAKPSAASMSVEVSTASIELSDAFRTHFAHSADWFDVERFPDAVFELSSLEPTEGGRYRAKGALTIKGQTIPIAPLVEISEAGEQIVAGGEVRFRRSDFGLGVGMSSLFVEVGDEVVVDFRLVGRRAD